MPADNRAHLLAASQRRSACTSERAQEALRDLARNGTPITFAGVAAAANVSRSWLYRDAELRAEIDRLRATPSNSSPGVPAAQRASTESLQQRLQTAHDDADALREEVRQLREEVRRLRDHLARQLGEQRAATSTARPARVTIGPCN